MFLNGGEGTVYHVVIAISVFGPNQRGVYQGGGGVGMKETVWQNIFHTTKNTPSRMGAAFSRILSVGEAPARESSLFY